MSRYDGLIIPRSYSEYINKTDAATLLQALQLSGVMDNEPEQNSNKPLKSGGVYTNNSRVSEGQYCGQNTSVSDGLITEVLNNFNNTADYSPFSGATLSGLEGYWRGFRHTINMGEALIITRTRLLFLAIGSGGTISKLRTIIEL